MPDGKDLDIPLAPSIRKDVRPDDQTARPGAHARGAGIWKRRLLAFCAFECFPELHTRPRTVFGEIGFDYLSFRSGAPE